MSWAGCQQVHTVTQRSKHSNRVMALHRTGRIGGSDAVSAADVQHFECDAGILAKGKRLPSPPAPAETRATALQERVHIDLCVRNKYPAR
jgi:hypothetical protein